MLTDREYAKLALVVCCLETWLPALRSRVHCGQEAERSGAKGRTIELFRKVNGHLVADRLITIRHSFMPDASFLDVANRLLGMERELRSSPDFASMTMG